MAGKQKINQWGGSRENAGRKPKYMMSDFMVKKMMMSARKRARELGKTLDDVLVGLAYGEDEDVSVKDQLTAISIFKAYTMPKTSEQNINVTKSQGMKVAVRLPPKKEDPALKVMDGGKG